jgi:6-phosphogluconate dehydrogenase
MILDKAGQKGTLDTSGSIKQSVVISTINAAWKRVVSAQKEDSVVGVQDFATTKTSRIQRQPSRFVDNSRRASRKLFLTHENGASASEAPITNGT